MFKTTAAYVSGGICGEIWWPSGALCGTTISANLRGPWGIMDRFSEPASFRDALLHLLRDNGGDFQSAEFTEDTVIRVERREILSPGKYRVHVFERQIGQLKGCADLVREGAYTCDFMGEE